MTAPDWTVLELHGLKQLIKDRAESVAASFHTTASADDLEQEGYIFCATNAVMVRDYHDGKADKLLGTAIWRALRDKVKTEARHGSQTVGLHRLYEQAE